jgi:hypothetical protein
MGMMKFHVYIPQYLPEIGSRYPAQKFANHYQLAQFSEGFEEMRP